MATLNIPQNSKAQKGRLRKTLPGVDLTAMVDLAFLLITFFILTTTLAKFKAADVAKPIPSEIEAPYPASRTLTVLLGKNNQVAYFMGETAKAALKIVPLKSLDAVIESNKLAIAKLHQNNPAKHMIVIIKPTENSIYQDFVDVIDEMKINNIRSYAIDDQNISAKEQGFLKAHGI
ncbi:ExbD/TolR family protein [Pedobacter sp. MW01-1-1]|uniref:ExbD/TolR family protein n=1 Tax=Pedobacter sp. MW01-1-1 TaxID=3383027 RepID=UPI003FF03D26